MANATVSNVGQINGAGDTKALFLKVFGGEVLAAFEEANAFADKHRVRSISSGKSAQFPVTGNIADAVYHTPGSEIVGQAIPHAEKTITIDDLLISHAFIAEIDEAMNHYDVRSIYSGEIGRALAKRYDMNVAQVGILAARSATPITGQSKRAGARLNLGATIATDGDALAAAIFSAAQAMDEKDVPSDGRYSALRPAQYSLLAQTTKVLNKDWNGSGSYSDGKVLKIADVTLVKTNHLPSTNVTTGPTAYQGDFSDTVSLVWREDAMGTVKLMNLAVESEWDIRRQGTLMIAKYAVGHGVLRGESAVEISKAAA